MWVTLNRHVATSRGKKCMLGYFSNPHKSAPESSTESMEEEHFQAFGLLVPKYQQELILRC